MTLDSVTDPLPDGAIERCLSNPNQKAYIAQLQKEKKRRDAERAQAAAQEKARRAAARGRALAELQRVAAEADGSYAAGHQEWAKANVGFREGANTRGREFVGCMLDPPEAGACIDVAKLFWDYCATQSSDATLAKGYCELLYEALDRSDARALRVQ